MSWIEIVTALGIHVMVPLIGIYFFIRLIRKIEQSEIPDPPYISMFMIFATYGGFLIVVLTTLFWKWSGMASIGYAYLILIAPFLMGYIAISNFKKKEVSIYHEWAYRAGMFFFPIVGAFILLQILLSILTR